VDAQLELNVSNTVSCNCLLFRKLREILSCTCRYSDHLLADVNFIWLPMPERQIP